MKQISFLLIVFILLTGLQSCKKGASQPVISVSNFEIVNFEKDKLELNSNMAFVNPGKRNLAVDSFSYSVGLGGKTLSSGIYRSSFSFLKDTTITLPLSIQHDSLASFMQGSSDSLSLEMVVAPFVHGNKEAPSVTLQKGVPAFRLPEIVLDHLEISNIDNYHAHSVLHARIANRNAYAIVTKDAVYRFAIEGQSSMEGMMSEPKRIEANDSAELLIPIQIPLGDWGKKLLSKATEVQYAFFLACFVDAENGAAKNMKTTVDTQGTLRVTR